MPQSTSFSDSEENSAPNKSKIHRQSSNLSSKSLDLNHNYETIQSGSQTVGEQELPGVSKEQTAIQQDLLKTGINRVKSNQHKLALGDANNKNSQDKNGNSSVNQVPAGLYRLQQRLNYLNAKLPNTAINQGSTASIKLRRESSNLSSKSTDTNCSNCQKSSKNSGNVQTKSLKGPENVPRSTCSFLTIGTNGSAL